MAILGEHEFLEAVYEATENGRFNFALHKLENMKEWIEAETQQLGIGRQPKPATCFQEHLGLTTITRETLYAAKEALYEREMSSQLDRGFRAAGR